MQSTWVVQWIDAIENPRVNTVKSNVDEETYTLNKVDVNLKKQFYFNYCIIIIFNEKILSK